MIKSYECLLLEPFYGSGQLCPSLGWTCFLVHGVPVWSDDDTVFGPQAILEEVRTLLGLKKAIFAMQPRWLRLVENIESIYSSITFAVSDPDGAITSALINGRAALFGKDTLVQKWIDKPALIQCSCCHALGHNKASKSCPLGKDSVKCYKCGRAHKTKKHNQYCACKHAVAGICDCMHFKCLNCHQTGHHCRDRKCPSQDLYHPRGNQGPGNARGKAKSRTIGTAAEQAADSDGDLYGPPPPATEPSRFAPASPTPTDFERMEQYERMEWDWDNQPGPCKSYNPKYGPIEGYDLLANWTDPLTVWNRYAQPTGWGSPPMLSP